MLQQLFPPQGQTDKETKGSPVLHLCEAENFACPTVIQSATFNISLKYFYLIYQTWSKFKIKKEEKPRNILSRCIFDDTV